MAASPEKPDLRVFPDYESMSRAAAELFAGLAGTAARERGRCTVALSGGSTPKRLYELLSAPPLNKRVMWDRIDFFWGDERCVPPTDSRSNQHLARTTFLDRVAVPPARIHPMETDLSPHDAAQKYDRLLHGFFDDASPALDLMLLGIGTDGHTASLFPDTGALEENRLWTTGTRRPGEEIFRLTMTLPFINRSRTILFLVSGKSKASILTKVLEQSPGTAVVPARLVRPAHGQVLYLVDRDAASGLSLP